MKPRFWDELHLYSQMKEAGRELFTSKGFENTSVSDLIQKLDIEEQTFYEYFESLDHLLEVIWSES